MKMRVLVLIRRLATFKQQRAPAALDIRFAGNTPHGINGTG